MKQLTAGTAGDDGGAAKAPNGLSCQQLETEHTT